MRVLLLKMELFKEEINLISKAFNLKKIIAFTMRVTIQEGINLSILKICTPLCWKQSMADLVGKVPSSTTIEVSKKKKNLQISSNSYMSLIESKEATT